MKFKINEGYNITLNRIPTLYIPKGTIAIVLITILAFISTSTILFSNPTKRIKREANVLADGIANPTCKSIREPLCNARIIVHDDNLLSKAHFQDFLRAQIYAIHNATNYIYVY